MVVAGPTRDGDWSGELAMKDMKDWSLEKSLCLLLCGRDLPSLLEQMSLWSSSAGSMLIVAGCMNARLFLRFGSGRRSRIESLLNAGLMPLSGCRPDMTL